MDFLKKHYEKIILGVVLLGLAVAVVFIPFKVGSERNQLEEKRKSLIARKVAPLTNIDLAMPEAALKRVGVPVVLNFSTGHRLFNPMPWQKGASGNLIKYDDTHIGPKAVTITKLTPLHLIITLDKVTTTDSGVRYTIGVQKEAAIQVSQRKTKEFYCKANDKNEIFALRKIDGPPENPTKLTLELNDTGETAIITPDQPFRRIDGYMADLKYAPENKTWAGKRVGSPPLQFAGEEYNVVAVSQTEVVLSAKSNQKKWPIQYNSGSTPTNNPNASL